MRPRNPWVDPTPDNTEGTPVNKTTATSGTSDNNRTNNAQGTPTSTPVDEASTPVNGADDLVAQYETEGDSNNAQILVEATNDPETAAVERDASERRYEIYVASNSETTNNHQGPPPITPVDEANALVAQDDTGFAPDSDQTHEQTESDDTSAPKVVPTIPDLAKETYDKINKGSFLNFVLTVFCFHWGHYKKLGALEEIFKSNTNRKNDDGNETEKQALEKALKIHRFPFFSCCRKEPRSFAEYNKNNNKDHEHTASMT